MEKLNAVKVLRYLQDPMQILMLTEKEVITLTLAAKAWMQTCHTENNGAYTQAKVFYIQITEVKNAMIGVRLALKRLEDIRHYDRYSKGYRKYSGTASSLTFY